MNTFLFALPKASATNARATTLATALATARATHSSTPRTLQAASGRMRSGLRLLASGGLVAALFASPAAFAQLALGTAEGFAVLAASAVTNTGPTVVTGDLGVSPGTSVTGFPPGVVNGTIHLSDAGAAEAQVGLANAYNAAAAAPCGPVLPAADVGGLTLTPGVYCFPTSAAVTGTLTLDFQGNPNATFLFKSGSSLTVASGSSVVAINTGGATCPPNVNWQVGSSATLGTNSTFIGNILALSSVTLNTGAVLTGRALARTGAVTLDTNIVAGCAAAPPPVPVAATAVPTLDFAGLSLLAMLFGGTAWYLRKRGGMAA